MSRWWPAYTASRPPGQVVPLADSPLDSGDCVTAGWGTHTIGGLVGWQPWLPCLLVRDDAPLPTAGAWKPPPEGRRPPGGEGGVRGEAGRLPWLPDTSGGADTETYPSINMPLSLAGHTPLHHGLCRRTACVRGGWRAPPASASSGGTPADPSPVGTSSLEWSVGSKH